MGFKETVNGLIRSAKFIGIKHGPNAMIALGVAAMIGGTVLACKATKETDDIIKKTKKELDDINKEAEQESESEAEEAPKEEKPNVTVKKMKVYLHGGMAFAKLYGPSILLTTAGIVSIFAGTRIINQRYAVVSSSYIALQNFIKKYRGNVIDEYGKEADLKMRYGSKTAELTETAKDENGNDVTIKKEVSVADQSIEERYYAPTTGKEGYKNLQWESNDDIRRFFIKGQRRFAQDVLDSGIPGRNHIFVNEICDMLGMERTVEGQTMFYPSGSIIDFGGPDGLGFETHRVNKHGVIEKCVIIDFSGAIPLNANA